MVKTMTPKKPRVLKDESAPAPTPVAPNTADCDTYHFYLGMIEKQNAEVKERREILKRLRRAAQDAGLTLEDIDHVIRMRKKDPETVRDSIRRRAQYEVWAGLAPGTQGDLIKDLEAVAEDEGYVDGLEGKTADGDRYDAASAMGQARLKGWNRGQEVLRDRFLAKQAPAETVQ